MLINSWQTAGTSVSMSLHSGPSTSSSEAEYTRPLFRRDFHIAIICALPLEYDATSLLIDEFWDEDGKQYGRTSGDSNMYRHGRIGIHNVVLILLPNMGKVAVAGSAATLRTSHAGLRLAFLVGVCGGAPGIHELLLGDVVVSDDVIQYDFGRRYPGRFVPKEEIILSRVSNKDIRSLIAYFRTEPGKRDLQGDAVKHLKALQRASIAQGYRYGYQSPGMKEDKLFAASYHHKHRETSCGFCCGEVEAFCEEASKLSCAELGCDEKELVFRQRHQKQDGSPQVFIGRIASGDTVMKSGEHRDEIAKQYDVIAFEMEGAGIWDEVPSIVVKGVCDYADSHKNKSWQPFAAATAAAVTKSMLTRYSLTDTTEASMQVTSTHENRDKLLSMNSEKRESTQALSLFSVTRKGQWQPLQDAVFQFKRALSEAQFQELGSIKAVPSVDSVLIFTAQLDYSNRGRKGTSIGSRFYSVLQSVREFSAVVESFSPWPSKLAVLLWGSVRLTVNVIFKVPFYYEALSKFFMKLGTFCPFAADYKIVFPTSPQVRECLVSLFSSVVYCCKHVIEIVQRPWHYQLLGTLWDSFQQELKPHAEKIEKNYERFECEVWYAQTQNDEQEQEESLRYQRQRNEPDDTNKLKTLISKAGSKFSRYDSGRRQLDKQRAQKRKKQFRDSLSTHDYLTPLKQSRRKRLGGTAEWLFEMEEFEQWINHTDWPVLFCSGKIGSGKTVLVASLIDRLLVEKQDSKIFVSFFFVRFDDHESLKSETILKSILWQALDRTDLPDEIEDLLEESKRTLSSEPEYLVNMVGMLVRNLKRLYIVIDGLDECQDGERTDLLNALSSILSFESESKIRIFLSGRESVSREVERIFSKLKHVSMSCQVAQSDISTYIDSAVEGKLQSEELVVGNTELIEEVKVALKNGADGMFLWVAFQIDELCLQCHDDGIRQAIRDLPKDLPETFNRALRRIVSRRNTDIASRSFRWVAVAKTPLTLDQLKEVVFVEIGQEYFKPEKLPNNIHQINSLCENLIHVDEETNIVQFAHHTVRQFLIEGNFEVSLREFEFSVVGADHDAGEICVTYLKFNDLKNPITRRRQEGPGIVPIEIARAALKNAQNSQNYLQRIAGLKLGSEENLASVDVTGRLANLHSHSHADLAARDLRLKRRFLAYASANMIHHTSQFREGLSETWESWVDLLIYGHEHVTYPWGDILFNPHSPAIALWAIKNQQYAVLRLFYSNADVPALVRHQVQQASVIDLTALDISLISATKREKDQLLHPAILSNERDAVENILAAGADPNASGGEWAALNLAARCGFPDIIDILLIEGADPNRIGPDIERSQRVPIQAAALKGHLSSVDRLVVAGADVNCIAGGETALILAANSGRLDIVQRLLAAGADPLRRSASSYRTAIEHAAEKGYSDIVIRLLAAEEFSYLRKDAVLKIAIEKSHLQLAKELIAAGADVNAGGNRTSLHVAASHGDISMVDMLLDTEAIVDPPGVDETPLHSAVFGGHLLVVEKLLAVGSDPNRYCEYRQATALQIAHKQGHVVIADKLKKAARNRKDFLSLPPRRMPR